MESVCPETVELAAGATAVVLSGPGDDVGVSRRFREAVADLGNSDLLIAYENEPVSRETRGILESSTSARVVILNKDSPAFDIYCNGGGGARRIHIAPGQDPARGDTTAWGISKQSLARLQSASRGFAGVTELDPEEDLATYLVAKTFYRRVWRAALWIFIPLSVITALRLSFFLSLPVIRGLVGHSQLTHRLDLLGVTIVLDICLALLVSFATSKSTTSLVTKPVASLLQATDPNRNSRRKLDDLAPKLYAGLISWSGSATELTARGNQFYANPGPFKTVVRGMPTKLPIPRIYRRGINASWIVIKAAPTVRLHLLRHLEFPSFSTPARWFVSPIDDTTTTLANFPNGPDYGGGSELARSPGFTSRRVSSGILTLGGLIQIGSAAIRPLSTQLAIVPRLIPAESVLPSRFTDAVAAAIGVAMIGVGQGLRMGQRRAMRLALVAIGLGIAINVIRDNSLIPTLILLVAASYLIINNRAFTQRPERMMRYALIARVLGVAMVIYILAVATALIDQRITHPLHHMSTVQVLRAIALAFLGATTHVPAPLSSDSATDVLTFVGVTLALILIWGLVSPVRARLKSQIRDFTRHEAPEELVSQYGRGTLDYFALRDDKTRTVRGRTVIAYGEFGRAIIVSPDPIGPPEESREAFTRFFNEMTRRGFAVGVLGASISWRNTYERLGMHAYYIGDEAIVPVRELDLSGKHHKSLRQAVHRLASYGYSVTLCHASELPSSEQQEVLELMAQSRRGTEERGFSMTLGRIFDPRDPSILLSLCRNSQGVIVGFCQWIPSYGGYSLDIMRRDRGNHPNGMFDFLIVETLTQLTRVAGVESLSLNFAAMRAVLAGERGNGLSNMVERWFLGRLSDNMQIESLWRFNAKFDPHWEPRFLVVDTIENLPTIGLAAARAESLWDIPVIGRLFTDRPADQFPLRLHRKPERQRATDRAGVPHRSR